MADMVTTQMIHCYQCAKFAVRRHLRRLFQLLTLDICMVDDTFYLLQSLLHAVFVCRSDALTVDEALDFLRESMPCKEERGTNDIVL